ncbi:MAG: hypothetical protein CSA21_02520 [Deltaproteobacteria bacterium]|nr:MAG: hypothetical protein CSA21_02520 [Deltaproteobacteria bacterium]
MKDLTHNKKKSKKKISRVASCSESLTSRAGLIPFVKYVQKIGLPDILSQKFRGLKKSAKGLSVATILQQIIFWMMDGTSSSLSHFDLLKTDATNSKTIGN